MKREKWDFTEDNEEIILTGKKNLYRELAGNLFGKSYWCYINE